MKFVSEVYYFCFYGLYGKMIAISYQKRVIPISCTEIKTFRFKGEVMNKSMYQSIHYFLWLCIWFCYLNGKTMFLLSKLLKSISCNDVHSCNLWLLKYYLNKFLQLVKLHIHVKKDRNIIFKSLFEFLLWRKKL